MKDNNKELIIFDLDGTLAVSKTPMDAEMSGLINSLLQCYKVAITSGGSYEQFQKQFLVSLAAPDDLLNNLFLFPTCATRFYRWKKNWVEIYRQELTTEEKGEIYSAFDYALEKGGYEGPDKVFGEIIEDRGSQVSFSALGQLAPIELKKQWDPDQKKRLKIKPYLDERLPEFEVRLGGTTTIDVTRKGIDKAYGIEQMVKYIGVDKQHMLFVGDALYEGGNDYPVKKTGVSCIQVSGPEETKEVVRRLVRQVV